MINRNEGKLQREIAKLSDNDALALQNYISELLSTRAAKTPDTAAADDLILALADQRENQCARQVFEWERARRKNIYRAA